MKERKKGREKWKERAAREKMMKLVAVDGKGILKAFTVHGPCDEH